jgi:hypothetical protein
MNTPPRENVCSPIDWSAIDDVYDNFFYPTLALMHDELLLFATAVNDEGIFSNFAAIHF